MADQLDNRPVFTIVMGCNGAGKSAWKRENWDRLPNPYFDQDSIAGGVGDWNSEESRKRTRRIVDAEIADAIRDRRDFGVESTYSGLPGPQIVQRVREEGYRVEGVYIGTESPEVNAERVRHRVNANTGHWVDVARLPQRHGFSLSNLRKTAEQFDELEIVDNSTHADDRKPLPVSQIQMAEGEVKWRARKLMPWCERWLTRFERSLSARTTGSGMGGGGTLPPPGSQPPTGGGTAPADPPARPADEVVTRPSARYADKTRTPPTTQPEKVSALRTAAFFSDRAARADVAAARRLLRRQGGQPPEPEDQLE